MRTQPATTRTQELITRKAKVILNKLSFDKFEKLSDDFVNIGIDSKETLMVSEVVQCGRGG